MNNKFGLVPVEKSEIVQSSSDKSVLSNNTGAGNSEFLKLLETHSSEVINIAADVVRGKIDIAKIEADTDAKCRLLDKEIDRIICESKAKSAEREQEAKIWIDKFEARKALLMDVFQRIENNPGWSSEEKTAALKIVETLIQNE